MNGPASRLGRIAVLMGGWSVERLVSLQSGTAVTQALQSIGIDATAVDLREPTAVFQLTGKFDRCFIVVHGTGGEDGLLQASLEILGLPYTGTGVLGSALGMDKWRSKLIWQALGLPVVPGEVVRGSQDFANVIRQLGLPLFIKPAQEGSSVGVTKVKTKAELGLAYARASRFHGEVLAEPALTGGDYTVAILGDRALPTIHIEPAGEFYDYAAKYERDDTHYLCPCELGFEREAELWKLALDAFAAVGGKGWGRVDFLQDAAGNFHLAEVNTVPGMTPHSLVPMAALAAGLEMPDLALAILMQTLPAESEAMA